MNRRTFSRQLLRGVSSYMLFRALFMTQAMGRTPAQISTHWLKQLNDMSQDLYQGGITPLQWQQQLDCLYANISLSEILRLTNFEKLATNFPFAERGVKTKRLHFPVLEGVPKDLRFVSKIFGLKKDRAVIPHGHKNMASCHLVLDGELHLRQYQKIEEDDMHMLIDKTVDTMHQAGAYSSISDDHQNVHWLKAESEVAFTFDVIVLNILDKPYDINNIDPFRAIKESRGLRVPKISVEEGLEKYGFNPHH